MLVNLKCSDR